VRIIIECPESDFSTMRPDTFTRTVLFAPTSNSLRSGGGPYIIASHEDIRGSAVDIALAIEGKGSGAGERLVVENPKPVQDVFLPKVHTRPNR
jgi:hypothetical protein